jgi:serine/threonine-protein kinase
LSPLLLDRYKIIRELGSGSSATIIEAHDTDLDRLVAIKRPHPDGSQSREIRDVFAREARLLARLEHPNIVPLYDYVLTSKGPMLVMRSAGRDLARLGAAPGRIPAPTIVSVAQQVADALDFCAAAGISHRDVKPGNITKDGSKQFYLLDFGTAAHIDEDNRWQGATVGTMPYVSPESLAPAQFGPARVRRDRSDQFAFGVTLYRLLTGFLPYEGLDSPRLGTWEEATAARLFRGKNFVPMHQRDPLVPEAANNVIARMLSIDPDDRFESNLAAANALGDALSGRRSGRRVFCSYSHHHRPYLEMLIEHLRLHDIGVWYDRDITHGRRWDDQIETAMSNSDVMLLVLDRQSCGSLQVKNEWSYYLDEIKRPIITLVHDDCRVPYRLYTNHHIFDEGRAPDVVANDVAQAIDKVTAETAAPMPHWREEHSMPTITAPFSSADDAGDAAATEIIRRPTPADFLSIGIYTKVLPALPPSWDDATILVPSKHAP